MGIWVKQPNTRQLEVNCVLLYSEHLKISRFEMFFHFTIESGLYDVNSNFSIPLQSSSILI